MKTREIHTVAFVAFAIAVMGYCGIAAKAEQVPSIDFLRAALLQQGTATVEVTYKYSRAGSEPSRERTSSRLPTASDPKPPAYRVWKYTRTPDVLYRRDDVQEWSSERKDVTGFVNLRSKLDPQADGTVRCMLLVRNLESKWMGMDRIETTFLPLHCRTDDMSTWSLYGWLKYGTVSAERETVEGHECWKVVITDTGPSIIKRIEAWLDPTIGYNPRRVDVHGNGSSNGEWSKVITYSDYREVAGGVWFPARMVVNETWPNGATADSILRRRSCAAAERFRRRSLWSSSPRERKSA